MKLTDKEKAFLLQNKELISAIFNKRIEGIKESMVAESVNRDRKADLIIELRYLMRDMFTKDKEKEKEEFI